ncbi:ligase [Malaciobacter halophilus]|uniref:Ligase n=1 Tax=Malaciobacter halophilus TaxID=197482 RepID=A0A2N1J209_9BACT|nr:ligase [Malaciobacter halophilus]AXH10101.1 lipoate--protein ligase A [Malaciobacter halophilus]PKI80586.1 ligase [Malaciobacter halophilus]
MKKNKIFRLILSDNETAMFNMTLDKTLVSLFEEQNLPILRLYTWQNSFSVGLSQKCEDYPTYVKKFKNNCAKRITGGGVLFHGHDLSYSLVLPSSDFEGLSVKQSYENICQFLLKFYKDLGLNSCFAKDSQDVTLSKSEFCQVGFEAYDILVNNTKIGGNAQKRTKKVIFQHGSIPIKGIKNDEKIGSTLEDFNINLSFEEAKKRVIKAFENSFKATLKNSSLTKEENEKLIQLLGENK